MSKKNKSKTIAKSISKKQQMRNAKYHLLYKHTKDSVLSRQARDWSYDRINREIKNLNVNVYNVDRKLTEVTRETTIKPKRKFRYEEKFKGISYFDVKFSDKEIRDLIKSTETTKDARLNKNKRLQEFYNIAIRKGFTPEEAKRMKQWKAESFFKAINDNVIISVNSRRKQWSLWSSKNQYDHPYALTKEAERINIERGFDPNDGFGWAMVYSAFTEGATAKEWADNSIVNGNLPEIYEAVRPIQLS